MKNFHAIALLSLTFTSMAASAIPRQDELECGLPDGSKFILEAKYDWEPLARIIPADIAERLNQGPFKVYFQPKSAAIDRQEVHLWRRQKRQSSCRCRWRQHHDDGQDLRVLLPEYVRQRRQLGSRPGRHDQVQCVAASPGRQYGLHDAVSQAVVQIGAMVNTRQLVLAGLGVVLLACLTGLIAAPPSKGPGMIVTSNSAIKDMDVTIKSARLPDGTAFPHAGGLSGKRRTNENPLNGGATEGAAPDGRQLPEYVDFEWRESPVAPPDPTPNDPFSQAHQEWETKMMAEFYSHPIKKQRVFIRNRVPQELVNKVIEANRHSVKGIGDQAHIGIYFIWTDYGIKLRWQIWHTLAFNAQYFSDEGGDEIVPSGTTMIAAYSNTIKNDRFRVDPGSPDAFPTRYPTSKSGTFFSGAPGIAYTNRPVSGGEKLMAFESEPQLPEWVDFNWRLFPISISIPRKSGESDSDYETRTIPFFRAVPVKNQRVQVRSRIPQEVQDEIAAATRNAQPHKAASSLIYLYFIWTDSGIKLHWRLKRSQPDGSFVSVREGGDELTQAAGR